MFNAMLAAKEAKWGALKNEGPLKCGGLPDAQLPPFLTHCPTLLQFFSLPEAANRMLELSDVFGGVTPLTRVEKNEKLKGSRIVEQEKPRPNVCSS